MLWLMITLMMIVMMMMMGVIMEAAMLTIKHTEVTEAALTGRTAVTTGVMRTQRDLIMMMMMMMTVITCHLRS